MEENGEVKTRRGHNNRLLFWILGGLLVLIVGLGVGIGVLVNQSHQRELEQEQALENAEEMLPEELRGDDLSPEDEVNKEASLMLNDPNYSNDDIIAYYDKVIEEAIRNNELDFAVGIIVQEMNFIEVFDNCERAIEYINGLDLSYFDDDAKRYIASYIISTAGSCEDQELEKKWENFYNELREG